MNATRTLTSLGFTAPANWRSLAVGEQLDYLNAIIASASAAYTRLDTPSYRDTRAELAAMKLSAAVAS